MLVCEVRLINVVSQESAFVRLLRAACSMHTAKLCVCGGLSFTGSAYPRRGVWGFRVVGCACGWGVGAQLSFCLGWGLGVAVVFGVVFVCCAFGWV